MLSSKQKDKGIMSKSVNVKYDRFLKCGENSWLVEIASQHCYFPYSLCELDEVSKVILCPMWLIIKKELENFIDEWRRTKCN